VTSKPSKAARAFILVPSTLAFFPSIFDRPKINIAEVSKNPGGGGAVSLSVSPYMALITIVLVLNIPLP